MFIFFVCVLLMSKQCNLKIGSINIGGNAKVRCLCPDVVEIINSHDIFVILESWLGADDSCPHMDGFLNFRSERKKKRKARRNSGGGGGGGGASLYICKNIAKGVTKIENSSTEAIWMKLDKLTSANTKISFYVLSTLHPVIPCNALSQMMGMIDTINCQMK